MNLSKEALYTRMIGTLAAGTTDHQSDVTLDMKAYESVQFVASLGVVASGARILLVPQESATTASTSMAALSADAGSTATASTGEGSRLVISDIYRPNDRYVSCKIDRGTANATVESVMAIQYDAKYSPVSQSTTYVMASTWNNSPST